MHLLVTVAKQAVEQFVKQGTVMPPPQDIPSEYLEKAGVFVSLKKKGELRGCIGTFSPCTENIIREIIANAVSAAVRDPRFSPVGPDELDDLAYSVDILSTPERVSDETRLDPKQYGIILQSGQRRGLLLPDLEGVDTVTDQLRITRMKAGIRPDETAEIYRFTVTRYT
ncbi:MAG: AMMECR1 domain-containing protein [Thermodesulfovibrio sp.]|nr:AMMECR1 domain-containing protein [Thermodesulfovibrio sp.]